MGRNFIDWGFCFFIFILIFSLQKIKIVAKEVENMDERNIIDRLLEERNGYIRLVEAQNEGLSKYSVLDYIRKNEMEKIAPGIYILPDAWEDRLYSIQLRNRKIVFPMKQPCIFIIFPTESLFHR